MVECSVVWNVAASKTVRVSARVIVKLHKATI